MWLFFFKQKTAYEILAGLVGSEMCMRDRYRGGEVTKAVAVASGGTSSGPSPSAISSGVARSWLLSPPLASISVHRPLAIPVVFSTRSAVPAPPVVGLSLIHI